MGICWTTQGALFIIAILCVLMIIVKVAIFIMERKDHECSDTNEVQVPED